MAAPDRLELLLLHVVSLDGSTWARQMDLLPDATHAPRLYRFGDRIVVPECGHYAPIEKPDILNAILRDVIAEQERR